MTMEAPLLQILLNGLLIGGIYAMASIGVTLIWGVMNFINFASGQTVMLGMYVTLVTTTALGIDPLIGVIASTILLFPLGLLIEKSIISPIISSPRLYQLVVSLALGLMIENVALMLWGGEIMLMPKVGSMKLLSQVLVVGPLRMTPAKALPLPAAILLTIALHYFLTRTRTGLGIRAVAQNSYAANLMGIDINRAYFLTWGVGLSFMGLAGGLLMLFQPVYPAVGWEFILISFMAVTMGGAGSYLGSLVGSELIGVIESLSGFFLIPAIRQVIYLTIFILVLFVRPQGLFPTKEVG